MSNIHDQNLETRAQFFISIIKSLHKLVHYSCTFQYTDHLFQKTFILMIAISNTNHIHVQLRTKRYTKFQFRISSSRRINDFLPRRLFRILSTPGERGTRSPMKLLAN